MALFFSPSPWTPTFTYTGELMPPYAGFLDPFSILTLCLIALGCHLLIAHPKLFPQVFSARGIVPVGTWVVGLASFAPPLAYLELSACSLYLQL